MVGRVLAKDEVGVRFSLSAHKGQTVDKIGDMCIKDTSLMWKKMQKRFLCNVSRENMAKTAKRKVGDQGEEVACKYLASKGYYVIERNYWKPWGEIDIIAEKGSILSFVEVKSVSHRLEDAGISRETYRPEDNVHPAKIKRLHRAIQTYLLEKKVPESKNWQIDVACVFLDFETKKARVELLENIVL